LSQRDYEVGAHAALGHEAESRFQMHLPILKPIFTGAIEPTDLPKDIYELADSQGIECSRISVRNFLFDAKQNLPAQKFRENAPRCQNIHFLVILIVPEQQFRCAV
jgi:hypothetical protein